MSRIRTIYVVRHAIAAERSEAWPDDAARPLTDDGAARMRAVVHGLATLRAEIDIVCTSPLVRAMQTAEILVRGLNSTPAMVTLAALAPDGAPARIADDIAGHAPERGIALVGHEPGIGAMAAWMIGARHPLPLKKGAVCRVDLAEWPPAAGQGTLVWAATPKMLRALG